MLQAVSHLFKPSAVLPEVREGAVYRRCSSGRVIETAKVLDVSPDAQGIPHVRYEVMVEGARGRLSQFADCRILCLRSFSREFTESAES